MKQLFWMLGALVVGLSQANAAPKNYGVVTAGYNDFDFAQASDSELAFGAAFGKQVHQQWYAELGYLNLFDYSDDTVNAEGEALYLAMLGKASGGTGELFYKVGVARVDIATDFACDDSGVAQRCASDNGIAAGLVGLGFDYYVSLKSMVRVEYVHLSGEDSFSTHMVNIGFRYNFN